MTTARLPAPGPSFVREEELVLRAAGTMPRRTIRIGLTAPSTTDDGWWLTVLFGYDEDGVVTAEQIAPIAGPPPLPPLMALGPVFAGALAGLIAEDGGRQQFRMALPPPADAARPWACPLAVRLAVRWEPMRELTMGSDELAREVVVAFRRSLEAAGSPG